MVCCPPNTKALTLSWLQLVDVAGGRGKLQQVSSAFLPSEPAKRTTFPGLLSKGPEEIFFLPA